MINPLISTVLWVCLIGLDVSAASRLVTLYRRDLDKRKLIFAVGLLLYVGIYVTAIIGINVSPFAQRVFEWSSLPILSAFIFNLVNERFKIGISKLFKSFLFVTALTFALFFIPLPFTSEYILLTGVLIAVALSVLQYSAKPDAPALTLTLAIPSFAFCYLAIWLNMIELAIFAAFIAKTFLLLSFEAGKHNLNSSSVTVMKKQLNNAEENFGTLFNLLPDPAVIVNENGTFLNISEGVSKATGFQKEEFLGKNFLNAPFLTNKGKAVTLKNLAKRMMGVHIPPYEVEINSKEGKKLQYEINGSKIEYKGQSADLVIFRDVNERNTLIKSIAEKEERFRDITESTGDWVWEVDSEDRYVYSNSVVKKILGYSPEEILGKKYSDFLNLTVNESSEVSLKIYGKNKMVSDLIKQCVCKDGRIVLLESRVVAVKDSEGVITGYRGVDRDITEKRVMEEKLLKSEWFVAIGQLSTMVAHDLRNPLQSINAAAYCMKKMSGNDLEKTRMLLQNIEDSVKYSEKIIQNLLDYSANLRLEVTQTNSKIIVNQALSMLIVPENIRVVNKAKSKPALFVDEDKIRRVCANIITNAFDAMPNGGTLTVTTKTEGKNIHLIFEDTGFGIKEEDRERLWTPLFTTKAKGMGFGLPICKRIVEAHKGKIFVESEINHGTIFNVVLPLNVAEPKDATSEKPFEVMVAFEKQAIKTE